MHVRLVAVASLSVSLLAFADEPAAPAATRPEAPTVGVSAGWSFPQSVLEPNTVGVRFRLAGLTLEPMARLGGTTNSAGTSATTTLPNTPASTSKSSQGSGGFDVSVGATVRYPVATKGPVDLVALVGGSVAYSSVTKNTDTGTVGAVDRQTTTGVSAGLSWGLGVEWFVSPTFSLSADATNPLVTFTTSKVSAHTEQPLGNDKVVSDSDTTSTGFDGALSFRPTVRLMATLYF